MEKNTVNLPLVSICMPAYNAERYILETIDSILKQTYTHFELIIVNDGSKDNTLSLLRQIEDDRIKIVDSENKGQCAAANLAFAHSTGDYIKFIDADDLISPDFLALQIEKITGNDTQIASAEWGRFYGDDLSTFKLNPEPVWKDMKPIDWLVDSFWNGPNMMQCALWLIPRKILEKSGLWDKRLSLINDFDFFIRVLLAADEIKFTKGAVLYYRSGINNSLSRQKSREAYESAFLSTKLGIENLLNFENSKRIRKISADNMQMWAYEFYPDHMDLYYQALDYVRKLGGSDFKFPSGGYTKLLIKFFGWMLVKQIKIKFKPHKVY
ncbi:glycosyltransferase family 2 protein [Pedobacter glucosidilyticus]|uniref:glycosyltransferase family 2 protein n=1 Tax=Pedobacter glucosidilyticus TaxID=1122941 RepID=UPI0026EEA847|nr:glycosyltransferase family 2 protein [Pedobacter glucosidilyticus]